ncbi:MAG TPA: hypothetical protein VGE45_01025 [Chloroflexia bacterium]|jgi:hypothetical protein
MFEYKHVSLTGGDEKISDGLTTQGKEGWEAVGYAPLAYPNGETYFLVLLKRPIKVMPKAEARQWLLDVLQDARPYIQDDLNSGVATNLATDLIERLDWAIQATEETPSA